MQHKIGILVNNLSASQLTYELVSSVNRIAVERSDTDIIIFFENNVKPAFGLNVASMYMDEAWDYRGAIISTDLNTTIKLLRFPGAARKLFYVYDLEWLRFADKNFNALSNIYRSNELQIVARSASHADILKKLWNIDRVDVVNSFEIESFI